LSFSFFAELVVITDTMSISGAIVIVTSALTGPRLIAVILPLNVLRALISYGSRIGQGNPKTAA
jgi:hypothetical protein